MGGRKHADEERAVKARRLANTLSLELSYQEAQVLLDELSDVRGGARLPKLRQVCDEIRMSLALPMPVLVKTNYREDGSE